MPVPKPRSTEDRDAFISRCMADSVMVKDFPTDAKGKSSQRAAVCHDVWRKKKRRDLENNDGDHTENASSMLLDNQCWTVNATELRDVTHDGRPFLVAPCVMMTEGVRHGSQGPLLYLESDLGSYVAAWDGRPVVIEHPRDSNGDPIPAGSPEVLESYGAGFLADTHLVPSNGQPAKLKSNIYFDVDKLNRIAPAVLQMVRQSQEVEISTGLFADPVGEPGEWNGTPYAARATNFRPDHLAVLPTSTGACSWQDGCGIRANQEGDPTMDIADTLETATVDQVLDAVPGDTRKWSRIRGVLHTLSSVLRHPVENRTGFKAVVSALQNAVNAFDAPMDVPGGGSMHFVREVFDDTFIFEQIKNGEAKLFRLTYDIDNKGQVTLGDAPEEVIEQTDYVTANTDADARFVTHAQQERKEMNICELIAHEATPWKEEDREFLSNLSEAQLQKLEPVEIRVEVQVENKNLDPETVRKAAEDAAREATANQPSAPTLNDDDRASLEYGKRRMAEDKGALVSTILANEGIPYDADALNAMDIPALEKIRDTIAAIKPKQPDTPTYLGNAPASSNGAGEIPVLAVPTLNDLWPEKATQ